MLSKEFVFLGVIAAGFAFTNVGGLGGAGISVPIMIGLYKFDATNAVAISNSAGAVSGAVRFISHHD